MSCQKQNKETEVTNIEISNSGLGPSTFNQMRQSIYTWLEALATHVHKDDKNIQWSVRVLKSVTRPRILSSDKPLMLATSSPDDLPAFITVADTNGSAFRCNIDGISREDLGVAIDALNRARGKPKKNKALVLKETEVKPVALAAFLTIAEAPTEQQQESTSTPLVIDSEERKGIVAELESLQLGSSQIKALEDFFAELWLACFGAVTEGQVFVRNHDITPIMRKHFQLPVQGQIAQFYSVQISPFGKREKSGDTQAARAINGWTLDATKIMAFCEHKAGIPKRCAVNRTAHLPSVSTGTVASATFPELTDPRDTEADDGGTFNIVLTGEQLAAKLGSSTLLDVELIDQAIRLLAEHETHKANAEAIENSMRDMESSRDAVEAEREALLLRVAETDKQLLGTKSSIDNASVRLSTARHMIVRTRLPQETLEKLALMRQQLERMRQQLDVLFAASGGNK